MSFLLNHVTGISIALSVCGWLFLMFLYVKDSLLDWFENRFFKERPPPEPGPDAPFDPRPPLPFNYTPPPPPAAEPAEDAPSQQASRKVPLNALAQTQLSQTQKQPEQNTQ